MCAKSGQDTCRFQKVMIKTSFPLVLLKENCTSLFGGLGILNFVFFLNISSMFNSDFIHIISIFHLDFSHIRVRNQGQKSSPYKSTFPRSRVTLYNHEMGVKFENFDLFEHTSAFKMIIFLRV